MTRRVVIVLLTPVRWHPPGIAPGAWRAALAEDVVDLVATLAEVDAAIAAVPADRPLAEALVWPAMPVYEVEEPSATHALREAAAHGYAQAAVLPADVPDLPGLLIGKLLRPLSSREAAVAPALGDPAGHGATGTGGGLLGVAARLPVPGWLPEVDLDAARPDGITGAAPRRSAVAVTPGWRRLRGPADLDTLDQGIEGWDATRNLLSAGH